MREFRFFAVQDDDTQPRLAVSAIHDESGYRSLRLKLAEQYNLGSHDPDIQVWNVDLRGDRSLTLRHFMHKRQPLGGQIERMMDHLATLWGFTVRIEQQDEQGRVTPLIERQNDRRRNA